MKILQIITSLQTGGAEKLVTDMVPLLKKEGHQVDVLLFDGRNTSFKKKLALQGVNIYSLGLGKSVYNITFIFKLISKIKHYDIIHTHNTACQFYTAFAVQFLKKGNRPKLITTEHNTTNRRRDFKVFKSIDNWMYKQYNRVVAISDKAYDNLTNYLEFEKRRVDVIYNGIVLEEYYNQESLTHTLKDQIRLIMVAGFREQKDQKTVIKAMSLLPQCYHLYLVGDGVCKHECELLTSNLSLENRVHFLGIRTDIPLLLKKSDIIIMSSYYEGLSLSSIEGMASGRPFIASDVDGLHEITEGAGLLFPQGDFKNLSSLIQKLMIDKKFYHEVSQKCVQRARKYSIVNTVESYMKLYYTMLGF